MHALNGNAISNGSNGQHVPIVMITKTYLDYDKRFSIDPTEQFLFNSRYQGLIDAHRQFREQDYPADKVYWSIFDTSKYPHPFLTEVAEKDPRVIYMHVPDRNHVPADIRKNFPNASQYILNDEQLASPKIAAVLDFCRGVKPLVYEPATRSQTSMGAAQNVCVHAAIEKFGLAGKHFLIRTRDDDDYLSPNHCAQYEREMRGYDWKRMVRYPVFMVDPGTGQESWARYDLPLAPSGNGPQIDPARTAWIKEVGQEFRKATVAEALAATKWPMLGHDGCVHCMTSDAYNRTVEAHGGFAPIWKNEDTVMFLQLDRLPGGPAKKGYIASKPDEETFVRLGACGNISRITVHDLGVEPPAHLADAFSFLRMTREHHESIAREELSQWHREQNGRGSGQRYVPSLVASLRLQPTSLGLLTASRRPEDEMLPMQIQ